MVISATERNKGREGRGHIREVTSGFWGFDLLFSEESGEGDNVGVDALVAYRRRTAVVRHFERREGGEWLV